VFEDAKFARKHNRSDDMQNCAMYYMMVFVVATPADHYDDESVLAVALPAAGC
jgi:hypothetical protein